MKYLLKRGCQAALCAAMAWAASASAGISAPTRVQFAGDTRELSLKVHNPGALPSLVQAWIDTGDADADPSDIQAPFLITPTVFRVEPVSTQSMRILFVPDGFDVPQDRESRFYLNLLDIPPAQRASDERSVLDLAVHYRMPLIYRPKALLGSDRTVDAVSALQWQLRYDGSAWALHASNPSPYHVSLRQLAIQRDGEDTHRPFGIGEILPYATAVFQGTGSALVLEQGRWTVRYTAADERGYDLQDSASLSLPTVSAASHTLEKAS